MSAMGVDAYQTNQTSRTTFRAHQCLLSLLSPLRLNAAMKCRPFDQVPPLDWVPPPVGQMPPCEQESHQLFSRVDAPDERMPGGITPG